MDFNLRWNAGYSYEHQASDKIIIRKYIWNHGVEWENRVSESLIESIFNKMKWQKKKSKIN